jgi:hypothetical protein
LGLALLLMAGFRFYTVLVSETKHTEFISAEKRHENTRSFDPMKYPTLGAMYVIVRSLASFVSCSRCPTTSKTN